jgi:hypothetical protein
MNLKFTPSLEQFDKRDMPSATLTRPPVEAEMVRLEIPGGCWPGPQPNYVNEISALGAVRTDAVIVKIAPPVVDPREVETVVVVR